MPAADNTLKGFDKPVVEHGYPLYECPAAVNPSMPYRCEFDRAFAAIPGAPEKLVPPDRPFQLTAEETMIYDDGQAATSRDKPVHKERTLSDIGKPAA